MTARELLQAQAFHRQRLLSAFETGSADGPRRVREGRALLAGALIALLVTVGCGVRGW